jgi:putative photosynthetic complex assembly protein
MHEHDHATSVPRGALIAMAALVALSIFAAGYVRMTGGYTVAAPDAVPVISIQLRFEDRADGGIRVLNASDGTTIKEMAPGTHGFVRGMLRGLARDRYVHGVGPMPAFELTRWSDGRHSITDTATGTVLHLAAYGFNNVKEFASLLPVEGAGKAATNREDTR